MTFCGFTLDCDISKCQDSADMLSRSQTLIWKISCWNSLILYRMVLLSYEMLRCIISVVHLEIDFYCILLGFIRRLTEEFSLLRLHRIKTIQTLFVKLLMLFTEFLYLGINYIAFC